MEQYQTGNKELNIILEPFLVQLQNSNFDINSEAFRSLERRIKKLLKSLNNFDNNTKTKEFFVSYNNLKIISKPTPIMYRQFVMQLSELFFKIDDQKTQDIIETINTCDKNIENLENTLNISYIKNWFADFCKNISICITKLHKRCTEIETISMQNLIVIQIIQLVTLLQLILKLFSQELTHKILIIESRRFLIKRFKFHFDEIREILKENTVDDNVNTNFIFWVDRSLDIVGIIEPNNDLEKNLSDLKPAIEEVLCHAMSTAQICSLDDNKAIKASVQSVLHEFNQLEIESKKNKYNPSLINLYVDLVSDKLCILERRVNTAVLRISLKVFSDYFEPLGVLQNTCEAVDVSILSRSENDLDNLISEFDLHVDRIMQIGLFAIACSTDKKILSKMRSCLSNLESLECELIPALTTLYMEPSQIACLNASLFVDHWKNEVKKLRDSVFFIIDPLAFGQIVREEYKIVLENVQNIMSDPNKIITNDLIGNVTKSIDVLISVIKVSLPDMKLKDETDILKNLKNLQDVHNEVCSACNILFKEPDRKISERVLKRLQILLTMIERIIRILSNTTDQNETKKSINEETKLIDPSLNDKKLNINVTNIIERGQQILKDRSMLFRTPKKGNTNKILSILTPKSCLRTPNTAKFSENRKLGVSFAKRITEINIDETNENSLDLQITDILEELTCLMDTLR